MKVKDFYFVAETTANKFVTHIPDLALNLDDVIQELVLDLWLKHKAGKILSEDYAWRTCRNRLFNIFRNWSSDAGRPQYHSWTDKLDVEDDEDDGYTDEQFWMDVVGDAHEWAHIGDSGPLTVVCPELADAYKIVDEFLDNKERGLQTIHVRVMGEEVARAARNYREDLRALQTYGLSPLTNRQDKAGFLLMSGTISPRFLARLTKALIVFGATSQVAQEVIKAGLRRITRGQVVGNDTTIKHYRQRAGKGIKWERLPGDDIILRRGRFRLFIERT